LDPHFWSTLIRIQILIIDPEFFLHFLHAKNTNQIFGKDLAFISNSGSGFAQNVCGSKNLKGSKIGFMHLLRLLASYPELKRMV